MKLLIAALVAATQLATQSPDVDFLLTRSAADFQANAPHPGDIRDLHSGIVISPDHAPQPIICGRFQPAGSTEWTDFSTIKTGGYEQALGFQATALCQRATLDMTHDLSADLKDRLHLK